MARANDALAANVRQGFDLGYRNREDVATLRPNVLVKGSKNVLTNTFKRVASRFGYTLDGQRGTANTGYGIYGSFDWMTHRGYERNIRVGNNTTGTNGVAQYRYVADAGDKYKTNTFTADEVYWIDLYTAVGSKFNACRFWDFDHELKDLMLWVDGTSHIFMWSGAVGKIDATSWATGCVKTIVATPTAAGLGYVVGDILTITTGGTGATVSVDSVGAGGDVTAVTLLTPGSGYTIGAGKVTSGGTGAGCTIEIATIGQGYIKIAGTTAPGALGFLSSGYYAQQASANGNTYTYSTIVGYYLVGLSADPTGEAANSIIHQEPVAISNTAISAIPATFKNSIIENLNNQIYLAASDDNSVYVSQVNAFQNFSFSSPRKVGEGAILTFDAVPKCLQQQSDSMFISAGRNYWYLTKFQISSDNQNEVLNIVPIKTTAGQAAQADGLATKIKNLIAFVSHETQVNTLGISANFFDEPQVSDISFPIVHDIQATDFTDGQILYFQKYIFLTAPKAGVMFIYNMTQDVTDGLVDANNTHYWEAPQTFPFARLSIIDGSLYGHGYSEFNTFKLFDGLSDDGKPYKSLALFAYDVYGDRTATKASNEFFVEGYKTQATELNGYLRRGINGNVATWKWGVLPQRCLTPVIDDASIGKVPIGKSPIGGTLQEVDPAVPPKFHLVQTFDKVPFFEEQIGFSSEGVGQWWEIVSFGTNAINTTENQSSIYDPNSGDL